MVHRLIQPKGWPRPTGYADAVAADGRCLFLSGQIGISDSGESRDLTGQAKAALGKIIAILTEAGGSPDDLVRLVWYVTDRDLYRVAREPIGRAYREIIGRHFPAMTLIEVSRLFEPSALVEIEATAVLYSQRNPR